LVLGAQKPSKIFANPEEEKVCNVVVREPQESANGRSEKSKSVKVIGSERVCNQKSLSDISVREGKEAMSAADKKSEYKILIADDSALSRNMLARLLKSKYGSCDEAEDGLQAVDMVKTSLARDDPYDIILMDSEMPRMNGPDAAREIKMHLGFRGLVIGVTGNALPDDLSDFKAHGADDVLVKPIRISQFDLVLDRLSSIK